MTYLDPKNDLTFKKIFGGHKHLCISLLNSLLPLDANKQITSIEYLPIEQVPDIPILKNSTVDVKCTDQNGSIFIVEMQMEWTSSFQSRVLFNASKAYIRQLPKNNNYKLLHPVYMLCLLNDIFEPNTEEFYHRYEIVNVVNTEKRIEGMQFVFVELPKYKPTTLVELKLRKLWYEFLKISHVDKREVPAELFENEIIADALDLLEESSYSPAELEAYDKNFDVYSTNRSFISDALEMGLAEGIQQGKAEEKLEIAKQLLANGVAIDIIANSTGLTKAEINNIKHI